MRKDAPPRNIAPPDLQAGRVEMGKLFAGMSEGFALGEILEDDRGRAMDFRLLEVNEAFFEQTGLPSDVVGRPSRDWAPQLEPVWLEHFQRVARGGQAERFVNRNEYSGRSYEAYCFRPWRGSFALLFRDISEQRRVEHALQESSAYLKQMIASLPGLVWTADADGVPDFHSPQWQAYTGLDPQLLAGDGWLAVVHPDEREEARRRWDDAVRQQQAYVTEMRLRRHDGEYRWFIVRGTPILDDNNRVCRWFGKYTDVHALKESQQALQEVEQRYGALFNNRLNGVAHLRTVTDADGKPVDFIYEKVNDAFEQIVGLGREAVEGRSMTEVFPGVEHMQPDVIAIYGRIAQQGGEDEIELHFPFTGQWFWVYIFSHTPGQCTLLFSDISAQKQAEAALRDSEEELRAAFDQAAVGMAHTTADGHWLRVNRKLCDMLGYSAAEFLRMSYYDITHPDDLGLQEQESQRLVRGELDTFTVEKRYRRKNGQTLWVRETVNAVRDGNRHQRYNLVIAEDISRRRTAEAAREASEAELQATFEHAAVGITRISTDGFFLHANHKFCEITGYTEAELRGINIAEIAYAPDREIGLAGFRQTVRGERPHFTVEMRYRRKNGRVVWVRITSSPVRAPGSGATLYNVAVIEDISESRRDRAELEGLFRQAAVGMAVVGLEGRIQRVNQRFCAMTGYSKAELQDLTFQAITHPDDVADNFDHFRRMLAGEIGDYAIEKRYRRKDGSYIWTAISVALVHDQADEQPYVVTVIQDIDARKRLEMELLGAHQELESRVEKRTRQLRAANEALRREQAHARAVLETATDAYIACDADGRIIDWNRAAERILGWTREDILGQSIEETVIPLYARRFHFKHLAQLRETGHSPVLNHVLELSARRRDGTEFPAEISLAANRFGDEWTVSVFLRDITARKENEASLQQAIRAAEDARRKAEEALLAAEAANRAKSEFLATMSHEIRTPLNGVIGFNGLLLDSPLTAEQHQYAELARKSGESLLHLLNDFLDFSKIEAGRLELEPLEFDPEQEMEHLLALVQESAREKGLELRCQIQAPYLLRGDVGRLRQILLNLLSNAVKFTAVGRIELSGDEVLRTGDTVWFLFQVSDTGLGIDEAVRSRLFQPFTQADASTTRQYGGTGLGLAISKRLAQAMGGKIGFQSTPGAGSTFWVELPFEVVAEKAGAGITAPTPAVPALAPGACRGRVLVAEDNPVSQLLATEIFKRLGCQVDVAGNGEEAVAALRRLPYDLVFMDCDMPVLNGFDATRAIRADEAEGRHVPIIAMTASALQGDAEKCLAAGMDDFMSKPIRLQNITQMLEKWLPPSARDDSR